MRGPNVAERPAPALVPLVEDVHRRLRGGQAPGRPPRVAFYPYVDTKCTIRLRDDRILLRLSDHMEGAPDDALRGVVGMLLCRLWGVPESRVPEGDRAAYHAFVDGGRHERRWSESRRLRGRKHVDPMGRHRSLLESYLRVTLEMEVHPPVTPRLGWSQRVSRRRFGHWDADHETIVISQVLDDPRVPAFVLDYVMYHEILHIVHPPRPGQGRKRRVHPPEFVAAERRFPQWREADRWLTKLAR